MGSMPAFEDREQAGRLLSSKLDAYRVSNGVVVGIPHGGVCVAASVARQLSLPLEVMPCKRIRHPADDQRSIGSVSAMEVVIHDCSHTIPQDYLAHQLALLRNVIKYEQRCYYGDGGAATMHYKTVILVNDILESGDSTLACLREIRKQVPLTIVVAVPVVSAEAARVIGAEADDIVFLRMERTIRSARDYFVQYPEVRDEGVRRFLEAAVRRSLKAAYQNHYL